MLLHSSRAFDMIYIFCLPASGTGHRHRHPAPANGTGHQQTSLGKADTLYKAEAPSNTGQHDTSKVLRLPRKMTMEVAKVLCLSRKMQLIMSNCRTSIAPAAHKTTFDTL
jgi:hypothetical protein